MTTLLVLLAVAAVVVVALLVGRSRNDDPAGEVERFQRARGRTTEWSRTGAVRAMAAPGTGESAPEPESPAERRADERGERDPSQ
jgi:hypothetical protein